MIEKEFIKGDTFGFRSKLNLHSGKEITAEDIYSAFVTVKEIPDKNAPVIIQKELKDFKVSDGYIHVFFKIEDTENLEAKTYYFDLEVTLNTTPKYRKTRRGTITLLDSTTN